MTSSRVRRFCASGWSRPSRLLIFSRPTGAEIVAAGVEEEACEVVLRGLQRHPIAPHQGVDLLQGVVLRQRLVDQEGLPDGVVAAVVVDEEEVELLDLRLAQPLDRLGGDRLVLLEVDLAGLGVKDVAGGDLADEVLLVDLELVDAGVLQARDGPLGNAVPGPLEHLPGLRMDEVLGCLGPLQELGVDLPEDLALREGDLLLRVEGPQNVAGGQAEGLEEYRGGEPAAAVDARVEHVPGIELQVHPGAARGDDLRREERLSRCLQTGLVLREDDPRRTLHLADDDPLDAVDHEGPLRGHQGQVSEVDLLLADILHPPGPSRLSRLEHAQPEAGLDRGSVVDALLLGLLNGALRVAQLVGNELQLRGSLVVLDRKDGLEHRLQTGHAALGLRDVQLQELPEGLPLDLNQVGDPQQDRYLGEVLPETHEGRCE